MEILPNYPIVHNHPSSLLSNWQGSFLGSPRSPHRPGLRNSLGNLGIDLHGIGTLKWRMATPRLELPEPISWQGANGLKGPVLRSFQRNLWQSETQFISKWVSSYTNSLRVVARSDCTEVLCHNNCILNVVRCNISLTMEISRTLVLKSPSWISTFVYPPFEWHKLEDQDAKCPPILTSRMNLKIYENFTYNTQIPTNRKSWDNNEVGAYEHDKRCKNKWCDAAQDRAPQSSIMNTTNNPRDTLRDRETQLLTA